jgi:hypothetical protein
MSPEPRVIKSLRGAGKIYDWRGTGLLPPNGGLIRPLIGIEHIPVVRNVQGTGDFVTLANVLRVQGLSLQTATDSEGNIALYNPLNRLCYQARGSNQISYGTEHMHLTVGESWSKKQLRAAAWIWQYAEREFGIPVQTAVLGRGIPTPVLKRGHISHKNQAKAAGYNDRIDPGTGFDVPYVAHCVAYFKRKGHFEGA